MQARFFRDVVARSLLLVAGMALLCTSGRDAWAQGKSKSPKMGERVVLKVERDYLASVSGDDSPMAAGAKLVVYLQNGKQLDDQEITDVQAGKNKNTLRTFGVKSSKGKRQKVRANTVSRLLIGNKSYDVLLDSESKDYVLLDNARRDEVVKERLSTSGRELWNDENKESTSKAIDEYKRDYVDKVKVTFPGKGMRLHETKFFMFLTDMPDDQVGIYVSNLDRMYVELCKLFGMQKEASVWRGKCVVVAFVEKSDFFKFETDIMNNTPRESYQGLCHSFSNGKVIISCYRGSSPAFFGNLLVHETTHGFLHMYRSNVPIPSWLNEGLAEWVANVVVPESNTVPNRQREAIPRIQSTGSMDGMFTNAGNIEGWQYGLASGLAQFLIDYSPQAYGALFTLIKEGSAWQEALKELFGMSPDDLAAGYGRTVGIPALKP